jgi:hypothetical protein
MKISAESQGSQAIMSCQQGGTAVVTVRVVDLALGKGAAGAEVSLTVENESAAVNADGSGLVQFNVTEMAETTSLSGTVQTSYGKPGAVKTAQVAVTTGNVTPIHICYGVPKVRLQVTKLPDAKADVVPSEDTVKEDEGEAPEELRKAYDFLRSYAGSPNSYDSFKKVDHKFRNNPEGPVAEVPAVLACTDTGGRDPAEIEQLSVAFSTTVAKLAGASTARHKVTALIEPGWVAGEFSISVETGGKVEVLDVSESGKLTLPYRAACSPSKPAEVIVRNSEPCAITVRAKLLRADDIELGDAQPEADTKIALPVSESWVSFKKKDCTYKEFSKAAAPVAKDMIKLARIAALYWYSDTGDVLMNAYLRDGNLEEKLAERVKYLELYYKGQNPACQKLPNKEQIEKDIGTYRTQLKAQADMLEDALASDLLRIPEHDTKVYRGISFKCGTDVDSKFVLNKASELKGFSSSATDVGVAYRFMKDNASDMNVITLTDTTGGSDTDHKFEEMRKKRLENLQNMLKKSTVELEEMEREHKEMKKSLIELRETLKSAKLNTKPQSSAKPKESDNLEEDNTSETVESIVESLENQLLELAARVRKGDNTIETLTINLNGLKARIESVQVAKPPSMLPNNKAAIPVLYRITEGADRGRLLGKYSMHSGESEVLFGNGVHPTPTSKGKIQIHEGKAVLDGDADDGFKQAQTELGKDLTTFELRKDMERYKKYEDAKKEGASLGLEWPHGEGIVLISARMG